MKVLLLIAVISLFRRPPGVVAKLILGSWLLVIQMASPFSAGTLPFEKFSLERKI